MNELHSFIIVDGRWGFWLSDLLVWLILWSGDEMWIIVLGSWMMIHFQECWGKVTVQHVQVKLVRVSWLLHLVKQFWKAKNPERSKSSACSRPPVLSEWRWDIAFEGCCYLGYHFLSLCSILEFSWHGSERIWQWKNEEILKKVKWKAWRCNAGLELWEQPSNTQYVELLLVNHKTLHKL